MQTAVQLAQTKDLDKLFIPHEILKEFSPLSPNKAVSFKEFLEGLKRLKELSAQVDQRADRQISEGEAQLSLDICKRIIPILSDRKEFLLENNLLRDELECENTKNFLVDLIERPSIKDREIFIPFREILPALTESGRLRNGYEHIETIRSNYVEKTTSVESTTVSQQKEDATSEDLGLTQSKTAKTKPEFKIDPVASSDKPIKLKNLTSDKNNPKFIWQVINAEGGVITQRINDREPNDLVVPPGEYWVVLIAQSDKGEYERTLQPINVTPGGTTTPEDEPAESQQPETQIETPKPLTEPDWDELLKPENIAKLTPYERRTLIHKALEAGRYDPYTFSSEAYNTVLDEQEETAPQSSILKWWNKTKVAPTSEIETLEDLVKLSPLGRSAIWNMLTPEQQKYLNEHPFKEDWQLKMDEIIDEKFWGNLIKIRNKVDEDIGFKGLRNDIKSRYIQFKENRKQQLFNAAERGNFLAKWTQKRYLAYKRDKNLKHSVFKLAGYLGKEAIKTILSPVTNALEYIAHLKLVNQAIRIIQGINNFAGNSLATIGRVGGTMGNAFKYALLPTLVTSLMGVNPLLAAGIFTGLGLANQAFKGINLLESQRGFKIPFIDTTLRNVRISNELALNPHKYADRSIVEFSKNDRPLINEIRNSSNLYKSSKLFTAAKHLLRAVPLGTIATGLSYLLTGNLPLALLLGGTTIAARVGIGFAAERLSMSVSRGLVANPVFRHLFKLPGMSFLDAAEGAQWIKSETGYIGEHGFKDWLATQGESAMQVGPINVNKGMSNLFMLARTGVSAFSIAKYLGNLPPAITTSTSGVLGILNKIPFLTRIAGPAAILGYLGAVGLGAINFTWAGFLGVTFGTIAATLALPLLSTLIGIPIHIAITMVASKIGEWIGSIFDKASQVAVDLGSAALSMIPILQLGKALYDIVNSTIEDISDYARIGLIALSIIPVLGVLVQISENQASAQFETDSEVSTSTLNLYSTEMPSLNYLEYDCNMQNAQLYYAELPFKVIDIITLVRNNTRQYNIKADASEGVSVIYKNLKNINPALEISKEVIQGEIIGSCV